MSREQRLENMSSRFSLTEDRRTKGKSIMDEQNKKLKEILTPSQWDTYEKMLQDMRKKGGEKKEEERLSFSSSIPFTGTAFAPSLFLNCGIELRVFLGNISSAGHVWKGSMKTSKKWLLITLAAALGAGGLFAFKTHAAERSSGTRAMRGQFLERAKEKLGLTADQVSQIKALLLAEKDSLQGTITKLHDTRVGLREAIQAPDATESSVRAASAKVAAVEADLAVERLKLFGKISPILTEKQRDQVKEFQSKIDEFVDGAINRLGDRLGSH